MKPREEQSMTTERAIQQFRRVCSLKMQVRRAERLLYQYAAQVPVAERGEYALVTTEIQEEYYREEKSSR